MKEVIQAPRHWPLWGEFTGDQWIPRTKGQWCGKCFPFDDVIVDVIMVTQNDKLDLATPFDEVSVFTAGYVIRVTTGGMSLADTHAKIIYRIEGTDGDSGSITLNNGYLNKSLYVFMMFIQRCSAHHLDTVACLVKYVYHETYVYLYTFHQSAQDVLCFLKNITGPVSISDSVPEIPIFFSWKFGSIPWPSTHCAVLRIRTMSETCENGLGLVNSCVYYAR